MMGKENKGRATKHGRGGRKHAVQLRLFLQSVLLGIWFLLIFVPVVMATEPIGNITDILNGSLTYRHMFYTHYSRTHPQRHWGEVDLDLELAKQFSNRLSGALKPRVRFDTSGFAAGVNDEFGNNIGHRCILDLNEAWLRYAADRWDVTVGKNIFGWGTAHNYNPIDNINPYDLTDIPSAEKIGVFALAFMYSGDVMDLEAIVLPWLTPSRSAGTDNRWIGDRNSLSVDFDPFRPVSDGSELPDVAAKNIQFAMRLGSSSLVDGWDLSLNYYEGFDPVGVFQGTLAPPNILLRRVFPRVRELGGDFSTAVQNITVHGEMSARFTEDNEMDDDYIEYIAGFTYGFDELPLPSFMEELQIILEYAGEYVFDERVENSRYYNSGGYVRPYKRSILGNLLIKFAEETECEISGGINLDGLDYYLEPALRHKLTDTLRLEVRGLIIAGKQDSFLHRWRYNDRVAMTLTKFF